VSSITERIRLLFLASRQRTFPLEFRISVPRMASPADFLSGVLQQLEALRHVVERPPAALPEKLARSLGEQVFSLKRDFDYLMAQESLPEGSAETIRAAESCRKRLEASLKKEGVDITDYTSRRFFHGMNVNVVAKDPTPGITEEHVKETILPTIVYKGKLLRVADVIVAVPERPPSNKKEP
jgi:molecular chaperone GrpE (heat shock protein)